MTPLHYLAGRALLICLIVVAAPSELRAQRCGLEQTIRNSTDWSDLMSISSMLFERALEERWDDPDLACETMDQFVRAFERMLSIVEQCGSPADIFRSEESLRRARIERRDEFNC